MRALDARIKRERRRARLSLAAAAVLLVAAVGGLLLVARHEPRRTMLRADVPSTESPVFRPSQGTALTTGNGVVVVTVEDRT
jgi:hypothetical protein